MQQDPQCSHALRIRSNLDFELFNCKVRSFYDVIVCHRHYCDMKGWEQPTILSLGEDGLPPVLRTTAEPSSRDDAISADSTMPTISAAGDQDGERSDLHLREINEVISEIEVHLQA